ncbi:hypothetical protein TOPH_01532 [Tolypocladium ophioglossoides CBS 100239]|uniref:Uncharacterized protein n=1 Tax=Tolypocladium ophioglossoides (strain CBS 100239) TaxID=1163406 RepID=A0A0L0NHI2_TOLOC|nr:hypothetical protein TOPH_01532 [Tolypocladium ophioglossoides CBS 100239]
MSCLSFTMKESTIHNTPPTPWSVLEFTFSNRNTDSEIIIMCKKCFVRHLTAANFSGSPQLKEKYLYFLEVARNFELRQSRHRTQMVGRASHTLSPKHAPGRPQFPV